MAHNRGTRLSPHNLIQLLSKFNIEQDVFVEAAEAFLNEHKAKAAAAIPRKEPKPA